MSSDEKVFDFPKAEITSEEKVRRAMAEAKRLASLAPGEWRLWIDRAAERLGVPHLSLAREVSTSFAPRSGVQLDPFSVLVWLAHEGHLWPRPGSSRQFSRQM